MLQPIETTTDPHRSCRVDPETGKQVKQGQGR
jgi:hypothetical protein